MSESIYGSEGFYYGESSSLNPDGNFSGYRFSNAGLGFPGGFQTANQLGEAVNAIKQGVTAFEVETLTSELAETVPKQHFKEMRQLMKLSGVRPSLHGPVIDAAGFLPEGKGWGGKEAMMDNERRMFGSIESAHELNPNGNVPVVFHSSGGIPGGEWRPDKDGERYQESLIAINQDSGQLVPMKRKKKYSPLDPSNLNPTDLEKSGKYFEPEDQIMSANATDWDKKITELVTFDKHASELIDRMPIELAKYKDKLRIPKEVLENKNQRDILKKEYSNDYVIFDPKTGTREPDFEKGSMSSIAYDRIQQADIFLDNVQLNFNSTFETAFEFCSEDQRVQLKELAKEYTEGINTIKKSDGIWQNSDIMAPVRKQELLNQSIQKLRTITSMPVEDGKTDKLMHGVPQIYTDVEDFAVNKTAETFGNLAMRSYKKFSNKAPIIAIENMPQGMAFTRGEQMVDVVKKSREQFSDLLVDKENMSRKKANKIAEKQIGMTWDVGHINMLKKTGFTDEDIVKETETVAPYVKHLHLTDNFGYADTHLAPGMGNVPFKGILEELEKNGRLDEMNKIIEAGAFVGHFKKSPFPLTMAAMGSQIYGAKMQIPWSEAQTAYGNYFGGYGNNTSPSTHLSLYGNGFTTLPMEFGGQMPQNNSRFSGNNMA